MALDYKNSLSRYRRYLQSIQKQPLFGPGLWTIFSLLLLIGVLVFALRPTLVTISGLLGQIEQRKIISEALDRKILSLQKATDELGRVEPRLELLNQALPEESNWNQITRRIEAIATESGIQLVKVEFKDISVASTSAVLNANTEKSNLPANTASVQFTVTGIGEYENMKIMTEKIERLRRILVLSDVDISRDEDGILTIIVTGEAGFIPALKK